MNRRLLYITCALATGLLSLLLLACESQQVRDRRFKEAVGELLSDNLMQISESLAIIEAENKLEKMSKCMLVGGSSAAAQRHKPLCEAYTQATEEMSTIVRAALDSKTRPTDAYVFYL